MADNTMSTLLLLPQVQRSVRESLIFQIAVTLSQGGVSVCCAFKTIPSRVNKSFFDIPPEILERIHIRYFPCAQDMMCWFQGAHMNALKFDALLINDLDNFSSLDDFSCIELCASGLDCLNYYALYRKQGLSYFLAVADNEDRILPSLMTNIFQSAWVAKNDENYLYLKCVQEPYSDVCRQLVLNINQLSLSNVAPLLAK